MYAVRAVATSSSRHRIRSMRLSVTRAVRATCAVPALLAAGCATAAGGGLFRLGPHPAQLAGTWVDVANTTPTDTVAWVLKESGDDRTVTLHVQPRANGTPVVTRRERDYRYWYLTGTLGDTTQQAICAKRRARSWPTCLAFRLDTLSGASGDGGRRRLRIVGVRGEPATSERVFLERR